MKKKRKISQNLWVCCGLLCLAAFLFSSHARQKKNRASYTAPVEIIDLSPLLDTARESHPKMEWSLFNLMKTYWNQGPDAAREYARSRRLEVSGNTVRVLVETDMRGMIPGQVRNMTRIIESQIESLGGQVETSYRALIQSRLPISSLQSLADATTVRYIRSPLKPHLDVVSQGVALTGADAWHSLTSFHPPKTVKVAVLDYGFKEYENLLGSELPESVTTRVFRPGQDFEGDSVHGTACAEIVYDMAPDVELYLVHPYTSLDFQNAVDWLIGEGVDVISHSATWLNLSPGDGTGYICEDVQKAVQNGIVWVNAAGNYGQRHWSGTFNDPDSDGWHNFSGTDEILSFETSAEVEGEIFLRWNDWGGWNGYSYGGSDQDFDLYLYSFDGPNYSLVNQSSNVQDGIQWPIESIIGFWSSTDRKWGMALKKVSATKNVHFNALLLSCGNVEYKVPEGSLGSPADSAFALTVGATDAFDDSFHPYSSQGPTLDGRIKPDICAPSGVSTSSYGAALYSGIMTDYFAFPEGFYGTSASCPHAAGAVALLLSKTPYAANQVLVILFNRAIDYGLPGKDIQYGHGRLNLLK